MPVALNPYLNFGGDAREALEFYAGVFGTQAEVMTYGQGGMPGGDPDSVMHGFVPTPAGGLMAADMPPGEPRRSGNDVTLSLSGDDEDLLRGWWERLSEGGKVSMPLEKAPWGDTFGAFTDRYGIAWMVNIGTGGTG